MKTSSQIERLQYGKLCRLKETLVRQFGVKSAEARFEYIVKNARWEKIEYRSD